MIPALTTAANASWAIYYLYVLQAITDIPCESSWYEDLNYPYDEYQSELDMTLIQYFVQLLWECVKTVLPPKVFKALWDYIRTFNHIYYYILSSPELYVQWLCHYWASNEQSRETRVSLLPMLFLELSSIDSEGEDSLFEESSFIEKCSVRLHSYNNRRKTAARNADVLCRHAWLHTDAVSTQAAIKELVSTRHSSRLSISEAHVS